MDLRVASVSRNGTFHAPTSFHFLDTTMHFLRTLGAKFHFLSPASRWRVRGRPSVGGTADEAWSGCVSRNLYGANTDDYVFEGRRKHNAGDHADRPSRASI